MQHPYPFTSFDIRPCWPTSPPQSPDDPRLGLRGLAPYATPMDTLRVCLRHLELFCTGDDASLWDLRWCKDHKNVHPVSCQDRPRLIEALAEAFLTYENLYTAFIPRAENLSPVMRELVKRLGLAQKVYRSLSKRRKLPQVFMWWCRRKKFRCTKITPTAVDEALKVLTAMTTVLTPDAYRKGIDHVVDDAYCALVVSMDKAFELYGPKDFPSAAVDYAIAGILKALGTEEGAETLIAGRIRKRLERAPRHSKDR